MTVANISMLRYALARWPSSVKLSSSRNYGSAGTSLGARAVRRPTAFVAPASTVANGKGNPEIIERYPTTANEIDVEQEAVSRSSDSSNIPPALSFAPERNLQNSPGDAGNDWSRSYFGLSSEAFPKQVADVLMAPIEPLDVEMKPGDYSLLLGNPPFH